MIKVSLDSSQRRHTLRLITGDKPQSLNPDQILAWQNVKNFERSVREHFSVEEANKFVGLLKAQAEEVFSENFHGQVWNESFQTLRSDAVRQGRELRNEALKRRTWALVPVLAVGVILVLVWLFVLAPLMTKYTGQDSVLLTLRLVGAVGYGSIGIGLGSLASSFFANRVTDFAALVRLSSYGFPPILYVIYLYILFFMFLIVLALGIIELRIAGLDTTAAVNKPEISFFIGLLCGFLEASLVGRVTKSLSDKIPD